MHRLHAGRLTRLLAAAGTAIVLGFLLSTSSAAASPTAASLVAAPAAAPPGAYRIIATLPCKCYNGQKAIAYRAGYYIPPSTGFGRAKVLLKHNMYKKVVAFIVKAPNHTHGTGTGGLAHAWAVHIVDGEVVQILKIFAKYDTRHLRDNRSFGIVTAWCDGIQGKCPQWVNQAINAQAISQALWPANGTELTYAPPPAG